MARCSDMSRQWYCTSKAMASLLVAVRWSCWAAQLLGELGVSWLGCWLAKLALLCFALAIAVAVCFAVAIAVAVVTIVVAMWLSRCRRALHCWACARAGEHSARTQRRWQAGVACARAGEHSARTQRRWQAGVAGHSSLGDGRVTWCSSSSSSSAKGGGELI